MSGGAATLPFLGSRDYLHGTTLYRHLRPMASASGDLCFRIIHIIRSNTIRVSLLSDGSPAPSEDSSARMDWTDEGGTPWTLLVHECPVVLPLERRKYDEELILQDAVINANTAGREGSSPYDAVATAIPMFKALLKANSLGQPGGQWMFTRLDERQPEEAFSQIALELKQARRGVVAKSAVLLNDRLFGDLYFSWVSRAPASTYKG